MIIRGNNLSELLDKVGIKFETVKSGVFKDILSPDKPLRREGENYFKANRYAINNLLKLLLKEEVYLWKSKKICRWENYWNTSQRIRACYFIGDEFVAREIAAKMVNIDPKFSL